MSDADTQLHTRIYFHELHEMICIRNSALFSNFVAANMFVKTSKPTPVEKLSQEFLTSMRTTCLAQLIVRERILVIFCDEY
jgi:hypothetical protein